LATSASGACVTEQQIRPDEIVRLDGYQTGASVPVETIGGAKATLTSGSTLALNVPGGKFGGRFSAITVREGVFRGQTLDGRTITAPVNQISSAKIGSTNVPVTVAFIFLGGIVIALGTLAYFGTREQSTLTPGRALRLGRSSVVATTSNAPDGRAWQAPAVFLDPSTMPAAAREFLAMYWTEQARAEHASIPAFSRLSVTLVALGAPARLVEGAHKAALEEVAHARGAFALAAAYGDQAITPGPLPELREARAVTAVSLEGLAVESLVDGCFLEGIAGAMAAESLVGAREAPIRDFLCATEREERSHAELAWAVVTWCCIAGGSSVIERVRRLAQRLPEVAGPREAPAHLHDILVCHGWQTPDTWLRIARRTRIEVAARANTVGQSTFPEDTVSPSPGRSSSRA
jgi:hypothetical protein